MTLHYISIGIDTTFRISVCIIILVEMSTMGLEHRSKLRTEWINPGVILYRSMVITLMGVFLVEEEMSISCVLFKLGHPPRLWFGPHPPLLSCEENQCGQHHCYQRACATSLRPTGEE